MLYLYDPRINVKTETNYDFLTKLTGKSKNNLMSLKSKCRKIRSINCYLIDENTNVKQRKKWYEKEQFTDENWMAIHGSDSTFLISNYGRFKRVYKRHTSFLLPIFHKKYGHLKIKVKYNGVYGEYRVTQLVAYHFLGEPPYGKIVRHKNSILTDDFAGNLEYVSKQEFGKKTGYKSRSKPVVQLEMSTLKVIGEFRSAREAGRKCFLSYQAVIDNCNKKSKTCGGYYFRWAEEWENLTQEELTVTL